MAEGRAVAPSIAETAAKTCAPSGGSGAWPEVACAGMSIGHKGMTYAAKALAATAIDLFKSPDHRNAIRQELEEKTKGQIYKGYIPDGPPPIPKD